MSTRSMIFVAVNPKDIGKPVIYEPAVNTAGIKFYEDQEVKQWSIENDIIANRKYISIYCHSDGYPEGIGRTLITFYNDYEKAFNLMGAGAIVYLEKISESFMDTPPATSDEIGPTSAVSPSSTFGLKLSVDKIGFALLTVI